jgi:hypothetical protein
LEKHEKIGKKKKKEKPWSWLPGTFRAAATGRDRCRYRRYYIEVRIEIFIEVLI